jgi:S1/P1 Nuclease
LGDIHQPLHVGAEYFDGKGQPVDPDKAGAGFSDTGGNDLTLVLQRLGTHGQPQSQFILHTYWDDNAVDTAYDIVAADIQRKRGASADIRDAEVVRRLAAVEPANWQLPNKLAIKDLAIAWADEILPIAKEAHDRLDFQHVINLPDPKHPGKTKLHGLAVETIDRKLDPYHDWAGGVVREQLHKAGWRLAALLENLVD